MIAPLLLRFKYRCWVAVFIVRRIRARDSGGHCCPSLLPIETQPAHASCKRLRFAAVDMSREMDMQDAFLPTILYSWHSGLSTTTFNSYADATVLHIPGRTLSSFWRDL